MILLDSHTILWAGMDSPKLSNVARACLADANQSLFVSAASAWEIATRFRAGKLPEAQALMEGFREQLRARGYIFLSVSVDHSLLAGSLSVPHKDPFDRILVAQAILEKMPLLSADEKLDAFPIQRIW